ncbi:DUF2855 family protein [Sphingomicrobium sediminis]|uniref:DUF2855 family protein n=1 Tax=Sphingomicrobium sediminis TaxID=2950949 RepID=A0A9X2J4H9_9SPHN|nr:DUF2855 family protein [Sphingomicrobium sediminis]MCM8557232.1 DUF2855 family protein [Sphingomicrobium sediminis]
MGQLFEVNRKDLSQGRLVERDAAALEDGQVRARIERFSFTANNMTYGAVGDLIGYWHFFPASEEGWGVIPVWSVAEIVESRHSDFPTGERVYGYFPPADELVMQPGEVRATGFVDMMPHRQVLPPLYNRYQRIGPSDPTAENVRVLLAPLHMTSFCLHDALHRENFHDATQVLIASASSKTSLGLAFGLHRDDGGPAVVGLTSAGNVGFVEATGLYDQVVTYDDLDALADKPSVLVDMAGNRSLVSSLNARLGDQLVHRINVGMTHWAEGTGSDEGGDKSSGEENFFFAPSYILERIKEWGPAEFDRRAQDYVAAAANATFGWMEIDERKGLGALAEAYPAFVEGSWPPDKGLVITL